MDEYLNISDIVYNFIDNHLDLFNLNTLVQDHSIDFNCLKRYIAYQRTPKTKEFWDFYLYLYESIVYIPNETIIRQFKKNALELNSLSKEVREDGKPTKLYFIISHFREKSNFYFGLYFLFLYRNMFRSDYKELQIIDQQDLYDDNNYNGMSVNLITFHPESFSIYIFTDDVCYSGDQMNDLIYDFYRQDMFPHTRHQLDDFEIYLNVVGMSSKAKTLFDLVFYKPIIPSNCYIIDNVTYSSVYSKYCDKKNFHYYVNDINIFYFTKDDLKLHSFLNTLMPTQFEEQPLIYLSFKYPDYISTVQFMCYFTHSSNKYFIKESDFPELCIEGQIKFGENNEVIEPTLQQSDLTVDQFKKQCLSFDWIFQLKDSKVFKKTYPNCMYTDKNDNDILKLIKNCNFEIMDTYDLPQCGDFCYKPFYKKKAYLDIIRSIKFDALTASNLINEKEQKGKKRMINTSHKKSIKKRTR